MDYHELNAVANWDSYPLSCMYKFIDSLVHVTKISSVNANISYWEAENADSDGDKASFATDHGLFHLN